jgi:restriction system protein
MARHKQSLFEDLIDLAVLLAVISYFILHQYSLIEVKSGSPADVAKLFRLSFARQGAAAGQYLAPMVFSLGAVLSFFKSRKRKRLILHTEMRGKTSALFDMTWQEFEQLVGAAFSQRAYTVRERVSGGPDGGVDLVLNRNSETFLVQCKQWRAQQVGVTVVRELYGVMAARGATGGFVVTSGTFTGDAKKFAQGRNIELIGGEELIAFIRAKPLPELTPVIPLASIPLTSPDCPACGITMVKRIASKGKNAGNAFWGCAAYPGCRGTRPWRS